MEELATLFRLQVPLSETVKVRFEKSLKSRAADLGQEQEFQELRLFVRRESEARLMLAVVGTCSETQPSASSFPVFLFAPTYEALASRLTTIQPDDLYDEVMDLTKGYQSELALRMLHRQLSHIEDQDHGLSLSRVCDEMEDIWHKCRVFGIYDSLMTEEDIELSPEETSEIIEMHCDEFYIELSLTEALHQWCRHSVQSDEFDTWSVCRCCLPYIQEQFAALLRQSFHSIPGLPEYYYFTAGPPLSPITVASQDDRRRSEGGNFDESEEISFCNRIDEDSFGPERSPTSPLLMSDWPSDSNTVVSESPRDPGATVPMFIVLNCSLRRSDGETSTFGVSCLPCCYGNENVVVTTVSGFIFQGD